MAVSWLLEKEKEEGGHQAIIFGLIAGLVLAASWAIEMLVPFEGWWQPFGGDGDAPTAPRNRSKLRIR